jgi:hypothetical protein
MKKMHPVNQQLEAKRGNIKNYLAPGFTGGL